MDGQDAAGTGGGDGGWPWPSQAPASAQAAGPVLPQMPRGGTWTSGSRYVAA